MFRPKTLISITCLCLYWTSPSHAHGRLMEPPARNTMWRFGFQTPPHYEDSQLFCGGLKVQWEINDGKCGICGDAYNEKRTHETGGYMARNITGRKYAPGSSIDALIDIVANHGGTFTFQMCWRNSLEEKETEECFEPLKICDRYDYLLNPPKRGIFSFPLMLPVGKTCSHCILRWNWKSGNNWGDCGNGTEAVGCGPQETYRNCADVAVKEDGSGIRGSLSNQKEDLYKLSKL